jgi:hypothetical protein
MELAAWQRECKGAILAYLNAAKTMDHCLCWCSVDAPSRWGKTELLVQLCKHFVDQPPLAEYNVAILCRTKPNAHRLSQRVAACLRGTIQRRNTEALDWIAVHGGAVKIQFYTQDYPSWRGFDADLVLLDEFWRSSAGEMPQALVCEVLLPLAQVGRAVPVVWVGTSDERGRHHAAFYGKSYPDWGCRDPFATLCPPPAIERSFGTGAVTLSVHTFREHHYDALIQRVPHTDPVLHWSSYIPPPPPPLPAWGHENFSALSLGPPQDFVFL